MVARIFHKPPWQELCDLSGKYWYIVALARKPEVNSVTYKVDVLNGFYNLLIL